MTQTSLDERRWDRGAWLTLAFALAFAALSAAVSALVLRQPSEGCIVDDPAGFSQTLLACYGERPTPLRPGDELVAAGGVSLIVEEDEVWRRVQRPEGWGTGATIDYTVHRDGKTLTLPVPIDPLSWAGVARVFAYTLTANSSEYVLYAGFLLIFLLAPQSLAARALFVSFGAHFAVTKLGWAGSPVLGASVFLPDWLFPAGYLLTSFWIWLFWPSLLLLLISFPRRIWPASRAPRTVSVLVYAIPLAAILFTLITRDGTPSLIVLLIQIALLLIAFIAVPIHTFLRVRDRAVRAQTGWLLLSLGAYIVPVAIIYTLSILNPDAFEQVNNSVFTSILEALFTALTPLSLGIAITRYRLFDIDVVIRRTLQYSLLSGVLVLTYFGLITVLQSLFRSVSNQQSEISIVLSTLAIAALFVPLRTRIQDFIDRRFYRKKYNAEQALAQFAQTARDEVDMEALQTELLRVVQETMQPEHLSVWIKPVANHGSSINGKKSV